MNKTKARILLKSGKDEALKRFHPWVFSGAVKKIEGYPADGDWVEVFSNKEEFLGMGHYQSQGSISVRIIDFKKKSITESYWNEKIENALLYRKNLGLYPDSFTNVFRLIYAEGDGMPGLIVDYYNGNLVMQCHSIGFFNEREKIIEALKSVFNNQLFAIYDKSSECLPPWFNKKTEDSYLYGKADNMNVKENDIAFKVDWEKGQKTGFFIDQRENRKLLKHYSHGKKVLNTFCYSGGFSLYALHGNAAIVHSVDSSKKAIEWTEENVLLNGFTQSQHQSYVSDSLDFINTMDANYYDIIILDPPAYAKHMDARHNAIQGYKRLNAAAIKKIKKGGIIFTFSCSQVVDRQMFYSTIQAAAIQAGRNIRIMNHLAQPPDHPVSVFHPEGEYLKGLAIMVD